MFVFQFSSLFRVKYFFKLSFFQWKFMPPGWVRWNMGYYIWVSQYFSPFQMDNYIIRLCWYCHILSLAYTNSKGKKIQNFVSLFCVTYKYFLFICHCLTIDKLSRHKNYSRSVHVESVHYRIHYINQSNIEISCHSHTWLNIFYFFVCVSLHIWINILRASYCCVVSCW